jgi:hypothetical protein
MAYECDSLAGMFGGYRGYGCDRSSLQVVKAFCTLHGE